MATSQQDDLCQRCRAINLEALFQQDGSRDYMEAAPAIILGYITTHWTNSSCRLCQFFLSMIPDSTNTNSDIQYAIYKIKVRKHTILPVPEDYSMRAALVVRSSDDKEYHHSSKFINYSKTPEIPILLDYAKVNYEPLGKWCKRFREVDSGKLRDIGELPLLVIDCFTRKLVPINDDSEYFALSYVWGPSSGEELEMDGDCLPTGLPATVEDAITVVRELGSRYLWIDRYCLDKSNLAEFQAQLNKMAGIYRNAIATLVAAAGCGADYGLPGVGYRHRIRQPSVRAGDYTLWSSMSDPRDLVTESVWMSRAWTYQEAVCSVNWIVFTDEQVFYHRSNTSLSHQERGWEVSCEMFPSGGLGAADNKCPLQKMFDTLHVTPGAVHQHIGRYIKRQLSYQSDVLNGMLGILRRCGNGPYPMNHYYGVPILGPLNVYRLAIVRADDRHWALKEAFLVGLFWIAEGWEAQGAGKRRLGFPSWSWTGWYGAYGNPRIPLIQFGLSSGSCIELKLSVFYNGRFTEWEKMCYEKDWDRYDGINVLPQDLYIESPTATVDISRVPDELQGTACCKSTSLEPMEWVARFSDGECEVLIKVNLVDAAVVAKFDHSTTVPLKAIFLRQTSLRQEECTKSRRHNYVCCCALLVQEGEEGATKSGTLELTPDNFLVRWKHPEQLPANYSPENGDQVCRECRRAMVCLTEGTKTEVVKLI